MPNPLAPDADWREDSSDDLHGSQVVRIRHEEVLLTLGEQATQKTRSVQRCVQITMARRVPRCLALVYRLGYR